MFHVLPDQFVLLCFLALLVWAACNDAVEFTIPNSASLGLVLLYPIHVLASPVPIEWAWGLVVAVAVFVPCVALFTFGTFGGGDVKLLSVAALWAGPKFIFLMLMTMSLTGGVLALLVWGMHWLRRDRIALCGDISLTGSEYAAQHRLPYGVAIAAGAGLAGLRLLSG